KYLFAEQVKIADMAGSLHEIALYGPNAADLISIALDSTLPLLAASHTNIFDTPTILWQDKSPSFPTSPLIIPTPSARSIWMQFLSKFQNPTKTGKRPLRPIGWAAFNATRIEAGRPIFGIDFDDTIPPAETGQLFRAVSF